MLAVAAALAATAQTAFGGSGRGGAVAARSASFVTVSSMSEPPDRRNPNTTFSVAFTLANQGSAASHSKTTVRFYLTKKAGKPRRGDVRLKGTASIGGLASKQDNSRRVRVRIPSRTPLRLWFLVACATTKRASGARTEHNHCRVSGERMRILPRVGKGAAPLALPADFRVDRFTLPIGRPTIPGITVGPNGHGGSHSAFGDAEKSNQRKEFIHVGGIRMVADCKRTTNGDAAGPDAPFTQPGQFDEDGDEAKILIYADPGETVTFNSMGNSSRRNIPPGEGSTTPQSDTNPSSPQQESIGGEGKHMAIAAARDPEQSAPEQDWVTAYKVGTIYISTNKGAEMIFTGYATIDTSGIGNNCGFGGVLTLAKI
ncbi:MAG: hypothetical protein ACJ8DJ_12875 [Gemmatimonadales bacterium]